MRIALILACCVCLLGAVACRDGDSQTVDVDLTEWAVTPSAREMKAGTVTFDAHNRSGGMIHELAILRINGAGKENVKEIEDIDPGKSGKVTVTLKPGEYELACVIVPGEAGSTTDHYQQGMHSAFTVR
jgi:uncharacterized cupredoxin-like copper-binding protein